MNFIIIIVFLTPKKNWLFVNQVKMNCPNDCKWTVLTTTERSFASMWMVWAIFWAKMDNRSNSIGRWSNTVIVKKPTVQKMTNFKKKSHENSQIFSNKIHPKSCTFFVQDGLLDSLQSSRPFIIVDRPLLAFGPYSFTPTNRPIWPKTIPSKFYRFKEGFLRKLIH